MSNAIELGVYRGVYFGSSVAEQVAPERPDSIQVPSPIAVDQVVAFTGDHEQRVFLAINRMRREGMPEMSIVPRLEPFLIGEIHTKAGRAWARHS